MILNAIGMKILHLDLLTLFWGLVIALVIVGIFSNVAALKITDALTWLWGLTPWGRRADERHRAERNLELEKNYGDACVQIARLTEEVVDLRAWKVEAMRAFKIARSQNRNQNADITNVIQG